MSDRLGLKIKENAGKTKYSSLNLNQTYKGTKVETKTNTGPARHGLQSLGKINSTRRVPPPANLPSLKSENSGNDPTVSLVPSGGGGWGSTKEKVQETPPVTSGSSVPSSTTSQQNAPSIQPPQLQPQRPSATPSCAQPVPQQAQRQTQQGQQQQSQNTGQSQTQQNKHEGQTKTWGSVSSSGVGGQGRTYSHQPSPYFSREFPALNGGSSGEHPPEEKEPSYGPPPVMRNTHEPSWMERSGPAPLAPDYNISRDRDRGTYNGGQGQFHRRPPPDQEHGYNRGYPGHPPSGTYSNGPYYPHPHGPHGHSSGGRHPPHGYPPENYRGAPHRPVPPPRFTQERGAEKDVEQEGEGYGRPSIVKPEDIQALDDDDDDGGWAGAQEEVDYTAKLNFEDFDDEDSANTKNNQKEGESGTWNEEKERKQEKIGTQSKDIPSEEGVPTAKIQQNDVKKVPPRTAWGDPGSNTRQPPYRTEGQRQPQVGSRPYDNRGYPLMPVWQQRQPMVPGQYPSGSGPRSPTAAPVDKPPSETTESKPASDYEFRRQKQLNEMHQAVERARKRREEEEARRLADQKAGAQEKLKQLEEKRALRHESESSSGGDHPEMSSIEEGSEKKVYNEENWPIEGGNKESNLRPSELEGRTREPEAKVKDPEGSARDADLRPEELKDRPSDLDSRSRGLDLRPKELNLRAREPDLRPGGRMLHQVEHKPHDAESDDVFVRDQAERSFAQQRSRHDSESSDRSSGSRHSYHPPQKNLPPRFQQQRQQQQIPPYQQQHYRKTSGQHQQQLFDKPPPAQSVDTGLQSPTQPTKVGLVRGAEMTQPVRRIMKRSDSSSTAGDDNASVKSVDSTGEHEKKHVSDSRGAPSTRTLYDPKAKPERRDEMLEGKDKLKKQPVKETKETVSGDSKERNEDTQTVEIKGVVNRHKDKDADSGLNKDHKTTSKGEASQNKERHDSSSAVLSRKRDPGSRERKFSQEVSKRRRDDESGGRYNDDKDRYSGRSGENRKGVSYPVGSRGRGRGVGSHRGRGRGDSRWSHGRDIRDSRAIRSRESRDFREERSTRESRERNDKEDRNQREFKHRDIRLTEEMKDLKEKENKKVKDEKVTSYSETQKDSKVRQDTVNDEKQVHVAKPNEETSLANREEQGKNLEVSRESSRIKPVKQESRKGQDEKEQFRESTDRSTEKHEEQKEQKKSDTKAEGKEEKPTRGRGGFGKPPPKRDQRQSFQDYDDSKSRNKEKQRGSYRDREEHKRSTEEHYGRGRGRRGRGGREDGRRGRDSRVAGRNDSRYNKDRDDDRYDRGDRERKNHLLYSTRGGRGGRGYTRGAKRGGLTRDARRIGSGRFSENTHTKTRKESETADLSDDEGSETSSYTTATSASDERVDTEQVQKSAGIDEGTDDREKEPKLGKSVPRTQTRGFKTSTSRGSFNRTHKEPERPPRFQKQHEERIGIGRGRPRGTGRSDMRNIGPTRSRGRGRSKTAGERDEVVIPSTENWDDDDGPTDGTSERKQTRQREEKLWDKKDNSFRRSGGERTASRQGSSRTQEYEQSRDRRSYQNRDGTDSKGTYRKGEPFLAERQQAKNDGSLPATRESLPAAKQSTLNTDKRAVKKPDLKSEKNNAYNTVDSIGTSGSEPTRSQRKNEMQQKTSNIMDKFDLHNIAGVICIDDMTDDDSDISSTLSGFVEVTSRRAIKEQKDRQREEEEKRRRVEEKAELPRPKSNQAGDGKFKKNQSSKPPRFAKQHPAVAPSQSHSSSKAVGNLGKLAAEIVQVVPSTGASSNASSTNSTKRNSPITVERGISPAQPPIFNAWDRPLIVTPAKQPSESTVTTVVRAPDPLAVGSGKPSSSRNLQKAAHVPPVQSSLTYEEKLAVDDELLEITKEIESMALFGDSEELEKDVGTLKQGSDLKEDDNKENKVPSQDLEKQRKTAEGADKKGQPKPQREKPPRFERTKRKAVEDPKKELTSTEEFNQLKKDKDESAPTPPKRPNSRNEDDLVKPSSKSVLHSRGTRQQRGSASSRSHKVLPKLTAVTKDPGVDANLENTARDTTAQGPELKNNDLQEDSAAESGKELDDGKDSKDSKASSRKSSDPDFTVDRAGQGVDDSDNLFNSTSLDVNITTSSAETPEREQSVSPAIFEFSKKMDAARLAWDHAGGSERITASVASGVDSIESHPSTDVSVSTLDSRENPEVSTSTAEVSKTTESQTNFNKKPATGEQQNVCKVKPQQQQQPTKPQQSATMISHVSEESIQPKMESVQLQPNILPQDQYLQQSALAQYPFQLDPQLVRISQRHPQQAFIQQQRQAQPFLQQQPLQQMQQSTQQPNYQIVPQIRQPQSTPSPLSQPVSDVYQSFMPGSLYSANTFQAPQSVVPVPILASSATQTFGSTTKTQSSSLSFQPQQPQPQQGKPATASLFTPNVTPSPTPTVYMPFDASGIGGGPTVFGINQQPQTAQRQMLASQPGLLGDTISFGQQGNLQLTQQTVQRTFPYPQRRPFETTSQASQMPKPVDQPGRELTQSELAKHINAKPFEPPKRLSTPTSCVTPPCSSPGMSSLMTSGGMMSANIMAVPPSPPTMSTLSQSPPVSTTFVTSRNMSVSPVAPATNMSFTQGIGSLQKQSPVGQFQLQQQPQQPQQFTPFQQHQVHIQPTLQQAHIRPSVPQQQAHQSNYSPRVQTSSVPSMTNQMMASVPKQFVRNPGTVGTMQQAQALGQRFQGPCIPHAQQVGQRFPGPIQRPPVSVTVPSMIHGHPRPNQPVRPPRPNSSSRAPVPKSTATVPVMMPGAPPSQTAAQQVFRNQQHQKMLEQTKLFFAQQSQGTGPINLPQQSSQPSNTEQARAKPMPRTAQPGSKPINKTENKQQVTNFKPEKKQEEASVGTTDPTAKNKKPTELTNKVSSVKPDSSKPEPTSGQEKGGSKQDGKGPQAKRGNAGRQQNPLPPRFPSGVNRNKPLRSRPARSNSGSYQSVKPTNSKPLETTQPRVEAETTTAKESAQDTSPQKTS